MRERKPVVIWKAKNVKVGNFQWKSVVILFLSEFLFSQWKFKYYQTLSREKLSPQSVFLHFGYSMRKFLY